MMIRVHPFNRMNADFLSICVYLCSFVSFENTTAATEQRRRAQPERIPIKWTPLLASPNFVSDKMRDQAKA
jgi:hypothetical protein